jgi:hypothetical protein
VPEHAIAPAADLEVGFAQPSHLDLGEHRFRQIRIGHRHERPGDVCGNPALRTDRRCHSEHWRNRLMPVGIHPEASVHDPSPVHATRNVTNANVTV